VLRTQPPPGLYTGNTSPLQVALRTQPLPPELHNPSSSPPPRFPIVDVALDLSACPELPSLAVRADSSGWRLAHLLPRLIGGVTNAMWRPRLSAAGWPGGQLGALVRLELGAQHAHNAALLDGALVVELVCLVGGRVGGG
jgi:hypothetical protein